MLDNIIEILFFAIAFIISGSIHEFSHAYTAYKLGDQSQLIKGRMTLNPIKHIDPIGALAIIFFNFGWMKPVSIEKDGFKNPDFDFALVSFAGPLSNILQAGLAAIIFRSILSIIDFESANAILYYILLFLSTFVLLNFILAIFNLIPIPPLDGSRILRLFLPIDLRLSLDAFEPYSSFLLMALFLTPFTRQMFSFIFTLAQKLTEYALF